MKKSVMAFALSLLVLPMAVQADQHFADVPKDHWASEAIYELEEIGMISGYEDETFKPLQPITKGQAASVLERHTGAEYIYRDAAYDPQTPLTRAEAAVLVTEGFGLEAAADGQAFTDVPASHPAYNAIEAVTQLGILESETAAEFDPAGQVSRAFFAVIMDRALEHAGIDPKVSQREEPVATEKPAAETAANAPVGAPAVEDSHPLAAETAALVNQERAAVGAQALTEDPALSQIAQAKAEDMAANNYFDHQSPTYGSPFRMAYDFGYSYEMFGENIAVGYTSADAVMNGWMNSSSHRENLLNPGYTFIGIGYAESADGTPYWVHMFSAK
ncbi:CAP domain-containing protein [Indiicoccus explosivorum]|uniref:CAP domain-containing protein n=1 Tax=Indiicoccus explosivorum TaxID=1917864 RepID=UPI000B43353A|nr:CAP domain-containing protein [Indiicoccus explosivorum]